MNALPEFLARLKQRPLYSALGVLMILIAAAGFVPESIWMVRVHAVPRYAIVHVHAVVFAGWLLLFLLQAVLAATGHILWHRRMGNILLAYALLMFAAGVLVTLNRFFYEEQAGALAVARKTNLSPVLDMLVFPPFFCVAWLYRHKPEIHKRLMVVTATIVLYAAVVRIIPVRASHSIVVTMVVWSLPILVGMVHDLLTKRAVHQAYVVGLMAIVVLSMRPMLEDSAPWKGATNWAIHELQRHG